ncbi:hypothetical protein GOB57_10355 [Sinorhizobium meliloti]|nr:hypothetical protein [Sinorhizobium meliloti]
MTHSTPYQNIGPFKYVPPAVLARVAALANRASGRALDEALRAADAVGGGYELNAYRPSSVAVTAGWNEEKHVVYFGERFVREAILIALLTCIPAVLAVLPAADAVRGSAHALFAAIGWAH